MPEEGYSEGYADRTEQDLTFIRGMEQFYQEQGSEWGDFAERICRYQIEIMEGFGPPQARPRLPQPPTMEGR